MGDFVTLLNTLNLSPVNTLLLAGLFYLVKLIFGRLRQIEDRNSKQDLALVRLEERLGIQGEREDE